MKITAEKLTFILEKKKEKKKEKGKGILLYVC
jgi:hypothetical protein